MAQIDIPFTNSDLSSDDPTGSLMTIVMLIFGFIVFSMARDIGDYGGSLVNSTLAGVIGFNPSTGEDEEADVV